MFWLTTFSFSLLLNASQVEQANVDFPKVTKNVAYSSVASLQTSQPDEKITYGPSPEQYALFSRSKNTANTRYSANLVVLIHGGCWLSAYDIQHTYALATGLAQAGFNVWSLEYRRTGDPGGGWPNTFEDIKKGIAASAIFNNGEFVIENTLLIGHSAGGHLALLAGAELPPVKGVIGLAAITDIEKYALGNNSCQKATQGFMQGLPKDRPKAYQLANPVIRNLHANTWLLQGTQDNIVPSFGLEDLNRRVVTLEGVGHFDWIHPGSEAFQTLVQQIEVALNR